MAQQETSTTKSRIPPEWDRNMRAPAPLPPPGSCDCQFHIFGDPKKYPFHFDATFQQPKASFTEMRALLRTMGFTRGVVVHSMRFDIDQSLVVDEFAALPPAERKNFRAIGIVRDTLSDREMEKLNAIGYRGARFNIGARYGQAHYQNDVLRSMDRLREIGWHARLHVGGDDIVAWGDFLRSVKNLTMVIDHMGHLDFSLGLQQPALKWIVEQLKNDQNWWMKLSNGNVDSALETGWDDAIPFARTMIEAAPDRMIWGTDWPHTGWRKKRMMNDAEAVELFYRYVDHDPAMIRKILVDNPARLHGFDG
jgi:predicted TIM-barrel fold metal-dependent hydrolase